MSFQVVQGEVKYKGEYKEDGCAEGMRMTWEEFLALHDKLREWSFTLGT